MATREGFEPPTPSSEDWCSNPLSYRAVRAKCSIGAMLLQCTLTHYRQSATIESPEPPPTPIMPMPEYLVTITPREAPAGREAVEMLYLLSGAELGPDALARLVEELLHDPVVQQATWCSLDTAALTAEPLSAGATTLLEIAYRPGVTDNEGESVREGAARLGVASLEHARALRRYYLNGNDDPQVRAAELAIDLVQSTLIYPPGANPQARLAFYHQLIDDPAPVTPYVAHVPIREADDAELQRISREGILALDLAEMQALRSYFHNAGHDPTDGELETIAQTWSEHCSHKTFKARVHYRQAPESGIDPGYYPMLAWLAQGEVTINSLIKTFLMEATRLILTQKDPGWVRSAFVDNAGILAFDTDHEVSFKVETHNHPSALEPFGGANTGVGGVIRDVLGVSARPIANTDVLCFGMPDGSDAPAGVLPPRRVCAGVVAGVRDYGNKLGIPTVNGAVIFDPGYSANPLVYCGTLGIAPRDSHPRNVQLGDAVVVIGGRTGRDGIHGATFSSVELSDTTASEVGSAVQIGDPITEKKVLDVLLQARDQKLYNAITDCGAGGLSSAVGEMGAETGVQVELQDVPLKYVGLQPWEIWLSEAQERMVLAVPPQHLDAFLAICTAEDVEATVIGRFTDDGRLRVTFNGLQVVDLAMELLHEGRPQRVLEADWQSQSALERPEGRSDEEPEYAELLLSLLRHPNIASKEQIVRTYDHEVGGATVIKPLVGAQMDGPGDAAVLQPLMERKLGLALGAGIAPGYGRVDPYWMALAAIDEALRNVVAVGGDPGRTAILDNFCWGDPRQPDRMASLVRACAGCFDAAIAFGTPFISGKDSLNNEYRDGTGTRVAIPPTLLISALAEVPDVDACVTMDLKQAGNLVYLLGETRDELRGGHLELLGTVSVGSRLPQVDLAGAPVLFSALHDAIRHGLVCACHDLSEGGLAVAASETALAGELGLRLDLTDMDVDSPDERADLVRLFSESPSRFLIEVAPEHVAAVEKHFATLPLLRIGVVDSDAVLAIRRGDSELLRLTISELKAAWKSGLDSISFT
jgi:phosphoribosylformylglycinamidine synthase II